VSYEFVCSENFFEKRKKRSKILDRSGEREFGMNQIGLPKVKAINFSLIMRLFRSIKRQASKQER